MADYCERETIYLTLYNKLYDMASRTTGERRDFCFEIMDNKLKSWCDEILTANVRENVRGEWIKEQREVGGINGGVSVLTIWRCSNCGEESVEFPFCPFCGADMRGKKDG